MGPERIAQDPHAGFGISPKLTVTGRLSGTVDGRPVAIHAEGRSLRVSTSSLIAAWRLRRSAAPLRNLITLLPRMKPVSRAVSVLTIGLPRRSASSMGLIWLTEILPSMRTGTWTPSSSFFQTVTRRLAKASGGCHRIRARPWMKREQSP